MDSMTVLKTVVSNTRFQSRTTADSQFNLNQRRSAGWFDSSPSGSREHGWCQCWCISTVGVSEGGSSSIPRRSDGRWMARYTAEDSEKGKWLRFAQVPASIYRSRTASERCPVCRLSRTCGWPFLGCTGSETCRVRCAPDTWSGPVRALGQVEIKRLWRNSNPRRPSTARGSTRWWRHSLKRLDKINLDHRRVHA